MNTKTLEASKKFREELTMTKQMFIDEGLMNVKKFRDNVEYKEKVLLAHIEMMEKSGIDKTFELLINGSFAYLSGLYDGLVMMK